MTIGEAAGYLASALVFMTFYMKTMTPLRVVAILSNIAFITYAIIEGLLPVLILHLSLFPLNVIRLRQVLRLTGEVRESSGNEYSFEALLPFMTPKHFKAGETLFHKGDESHQMFYISDGVIRLPEIDMTLGKGESFGEIGLFSSEGKRLATAICETDCELLEISEDRVFQLYYQNPRFGFHMVRIITKRLIENYNRLLQSVASEDTKIGSPTAESTMASRGHELPEDRKAKGTGRTGGRAKGYFLRFYLPATGLAVVLVLLFFSWGATPYVHSILVRDAAVTTWSNVATAPIDGTVHYEAIALNAPVGPDGIVAHMRNDHISRQDYDEANIRLGLAEERVRELEDFLEEIKLLETERRDAKSLYADMFRTQLDTRIANLEQEIATAEHQYDVVKKIAVRKTGLASRGTISANEADEAELRVTDLAVEIAQLNSDLRDARVRRKGADNGIFITSAGTDPDWVFDSRMDLKLEKKTARLELKNAHADLEVAKAYALAMEQDFLRRSQGTVTAPADSIIWSRKVASDATVRAGDPIVEWLDCSVLLVDVPLPDVEIPLITIGMEAEVILDGESAVRKGSVLLARGSAATLGREDLVATGEEREDNLAQVVVDISNERDNFEICPVGRIAFVDFPEIGFLEIVSAWLRL